MEEKGNVIGINEWRAGKKSSEKKSVKLDWQTQINNLKMEYKRELAGTGRDEAINDLDEFINEANKICYREFLCDHGYRGSSAIINVLGDKYSSWEKETKKRGLEKVINYLDGLPKTKDSRELLQMINNPDLVADILANRREFWQKLPELARTFSEKSAVGALESSLKDHEGRFWFVIEILESKKISPKIKKDFQEKFPDLVNKSLGVIAVAIDKKLINIENFDWIFRDEIQKKIEQKSWIDLGERKLTEEKTVQKKEEIYLEEERKALKEIDSIFGSREKYKENLTDFKNQLNLAAEIRKRMDEGEDVGGFFEEEAIGADGGILGSSTINLILADLFEKSRKDFRESEKEREENDRRIEKIAETYLENLELDWDNGFY